MGHFLTKDEANKRIGNIGRVFPMYPPRAGDIQDIRFEDKTFKMFDKDEPNYTGEADGRFTVIQIHVTDLNTNKERVWQCNDFPSSAASIIMQTCRENGIEPSTSMRDVCVRVTGEEDWKYSVELLDEEKATQATKEEITEAINEFIGEGFKDDDLASSVKSYLEAEGKTVTLDQIKKLIK